MGAPFTPGQIVAALGGTAQGNTSIALLRIWPLAQAMPGDLAFIAHAKHAPALSQTQASCIIVSADLLEKVCAACTVACVIVADNPYLYYARLSQWWQRQTAQPGWSGVHASAVVHESAQVHPTAQIGPQCVIGANASIGAHTVLRARVTVEYGCTVGERCIIHSGAVIGADGFGFVRRTDGSGEKIAQLGAVRIGNDVEIGANSCIDRGALQDTVLEDGVKLDNLVQIGHNVHVGAHTSLAGCAGVAGSAVIGKRCSIGGGAVVLGHLQIADDVQISASTTVMSSITHAGNYSGVFPIDTNSAWERNAASLRKLSELRSRVRKLETPQPNKT